MGFGWRCRAESYYFGVAVLALVLILPHVFWLGAPQRPLALLSGTLIPVALAASLWGGAVWLYWHDRFDPTAARHVLVWTIAITLFGCGIAGMIVLNATAQGTDIPHTGTILVNSGSGGAVLGLLLGSLSADRRRKKEQLRDRRRRVRSLNERLLVLNRVLRHDIRNDINVIRGYVDMLDTDRADPEETLDVIRSKADEIESLSERARQIERLLRSEAREQQVVDLVEIAERERTEVEDGYFGVEITTDTPATAWAEVSPFVESVFDNLLENAVEHNDKPIAEVSISISRERDRFRVEIADNGPGLPEYERTLLQGHTETPLEHSDGIGLWLVDWIVEESGGSITVRDNTPEGTRVVLRLPMAS
jgi:signal transduction histidine kinase